MKILLIDYDGKIPNLALKKIEMYHQERGDEIFWNQPDIHKAMDKTYVSVIFDWNAKAAEEEYPGAEIGGSGYSIVKNLPPEIEAMRPRINLGFTTRGCIRKCPFCIVPAKEGRIRAEGDIYDIWDGKAKTIMLLDNNILALPDHFRKVCAQIRKENLIVDFNQGLDIRILTEDDIQELKSIRHVREMRFAFDNMSDEPYVRKGVAMLKAAGIKYSMFYILVGYNTTPEQDMQRLEVIRELNQRAYVMRHKNVKGIRWYSDLGAWVNLQWPWVKIPFETFCHQHRHRTKRKV